MSFLKVYYDNLQNLIKFLHTVTFKMEGLINHYNYIYSDLFGFKIEEELPKEFWPYYLLIQAKPLKETYQQLNTDQNLRDQYLISVTIPEDILLYLPSQPEIYIYDKNFNQILLTPDMIKSNPELKYYYLSNFDKYLDLCHQHPENYYYIKHSFFPIEDIIKVIEADDFTLLAYENTMLDPYEKDDLISYFQQWLYYVGNRWYLHPFEFEPLYPVVMYQLFLNSSLLILFARQILNIRTHNVNKMFIWEYLQSHGFGKFRNLLTYPIEKFLYKNLRYLERYKGTNHLLTIIDEFLQKTLNIRVFKYDIVKFVFQREDYAKWKSYITKQPYGYITDIDKSNLMEIKDFRQILEYKGYIKEQDLNEQIDFDLTKYNKQLTKFLTLETNTQLEDTFSNLINLIFNIWLWLLSKNQYNMEYFSFNVLSPLPASKDIQLSNKELYILFYYLCGSVYIKDFDPNMTIPTKCLVKRPNEYINKNLYLVDIDGNKFTINIDNYIKDFESINSKLLEWNNANIYNKTDFTKFVIDIFNLYMEHYMLSISKGSFREVSSNSYITEKLLKFEEVEIAGLPFNTFNDFLNTYSDIQEVLTKYDDIGKLQFLSNILISLVDYSNLESEFLYGTQSIYPPLSTIIDLVKHFVSYAVNFVEIETAQKQRWQFDLLKADVIKYEKEQKVYLEQMFETTYPYSDIKPRLYTKYLSKTDDIDITKDTLYFKFEYDLSTPITFKFESSLDINIKQDSTTKWFFNLNKCFAELKD